MRYLLCILLSVLVIGQSQAQEEYISNTPLPEKGQLAQELEGRKGVLVLSTNGSLIFRVTNASKDVEEVRSTAKNSEGYYEYKLILAADEKDAKVEVSRMGDVYTTEFIATLKPNFYVAYRIDEVEQPIRFEDQTRGNDVRLNAAEAELNFSSTIPNLIVECSDKLNAKITSAQSKADPSMNITTVVIPIAVLQAAKKEEANAKDEYDRLTKLIDENKATDTDFDNHDKAEQRLEQAEAALKELATLTIYADKTNRLSIDISDIGPRSKKEYAVLPLIIEKFKTEYSAHMSEGGRFFAQRRYEDAREAFIQALNAKDAPLNMKPTVMASVNRCDTCIRYERLAGKTLSELVNMKKAGTGSQEDVYRYAAAGIHFLGVINRYNNSDFYTSRIAQLEKLIKSQPLIVGFTIVEWLTLQEGNALPDVEVWAYYGSEPPNPIAYNSPRAFRRVIKKNAEMYEQKGLTDANGKTEVAFEREKLPTAFVFVPSTDESMKITSIPFADFIRRASGDYHMKQLRVKMYKRTNKHF